MSTPDPASPGPGPRRAMPGGLPVWVHAGPLGGTTVLLVLLLGFCAAFQGRTIWADWTEASELRHPAYAERVRLDAVFRTRVNTWSNLAYVLVGFYGIALAGFDLGRKNAPGGNYLGQHPPLSLLFGVACSYLGFGSGLFHASLTRWGQQLDVAAMYTPLLALIAISVGRWVPRVRWAGGAAGWPTWPISAGLVVGASYVLYRYKWSMRSGVVLPSLILAVAVLTLLDRCQTRWHFKLRWLAWSTLALIGALVCRQLDVAGRFSDPDAWLQGHSFWHLLTSLSLVCMYLYHRSASNDHQPC